MPKYNIIIHDERKCIHCGELLTNGLQCCYACHKSFCLGEKVEEDKKRSRTPAYRSLFKG